MKNDLVGWVPFALRWQASGPQLDWFYLGARRLVEPFFDQTIEQAWQSPGRSERYRSTSLAALDTLQAVSPGLVPTGLIFHTGRCGSTLIAQLLAALPQNIVVSEASILHMALQAPPQTWPLTDKARVRLLQGIISALGQPRAGSENYYFIKFNSRSILDLPLIQHAFPEVPWIFVYRDPLEVLVAHLGTTREVLPPGVAESGLLQGEPAQLRQLSPAEFWTRVLASRYEAACRFYERGKSRLIHYKQLPRVVWETLPNFWRVSYSGQDVERMQTVARLNAKAPSRIFVEDSQAKRATATEELRTLAESWVMPAYERLEALRLAQAD